MSRHARRPKSYSALQVWPCSDTYPQCGSERSPLDQRETLEISLNEPQQASPCLPQVFARVYGHVADPYVSNPAQTE